MSGVSAGWTDGGRGVGGGGWIDGGVGVSCRTKALSSLQYYQYPDISTDGQVPLVACIQWTSSHEVYSVASAFCRSVTGAPNC